MEPSKSIRFLRFERARPKLTGVRESGYIKPKGAAKRGGDWQRITLAEGSDAPAKPPGLDTDVLALHEALERLEQLSGSLLTRFDESAVSWLEQQQAVLVVGRQVRAEQLVQEALHV